MNNAIRRTINLQAKLVTALFTVMYFGIAGYFFSCNGYTVLDIQQQLVDLGGFAIAGIIYGMLASSTPVEYQALDLFGIGVWVVVTTGLASMVSFIYIDVAEITQWTMTGVEGELLAVATTFLIVVLNDRDILHRR